jgi:hypothetical protein
VVRNHQRPRRPYSPADRARDYGSRGREFESLWGHASAISSVAEHRFHTPGWRRFESSIAHGCLLPSWDGAGPLSPQRRGSTPVRHPHARLTRAAKGLACKAGAVWLRRFESSTRHASPRSPVDRAPPSGGGDRWFESSRGRRGPVTEWLGTSLQSCVHVGSIPTGASNGP